MKQLSPADREDILLSDWWYLEEGCQDFYIIPHTVQATMKAYEVPPDPENALYDPLILNSLIFKYIGVKNEYLTHQMDTIGYHNLYIEGEKEALYPCPCCGYETLSLYGEYEICPVCFWEDSGTRNPEQYSGPNHMTLAEGRENYRRIGASKERSVQFVDKDGPLKYPRCLDVTLLDG